MFLLTIRALACLSRISRFLAMLSLVLLYFVLSDILEFFITVYKGAIFPRICSVTLINKRKQIKADHTVLSYTKRYFRYSTENLIK